MEVSNLRGRTRRRRGSGPLRKIFTFVLVLILGFAIYKIYDHYSFTRERVDLNEYLKVSGDDVAIFINDNRYKSLLDHTPAIASNDTVYLSLSFVKTNLNNRFYYAKDLNRILYSLIDETRSYGDGDIHQVGGAPYVKFLSEPYLLVDFVKDFTNIRYDKYVDDNYKRVYVYTDWNKEEIAYISANESLRVLGGNKSKVITDLKKGEEIKILDNMTKWSKVKSSSGFIGYIRNSRIKNITEVIPSSDFKEQTKQKYNFGEKIVLGFHQMTQIYNTKNLPEVLKSTKGMNVISPTFFTLKNNDGEIRSLASADYVKLCHNRGLKVWPTFTNFEIPEAKISIKEVFGSAIKRKRVIDKLIQQVNATGIDGINIDIESVPQSAGDDYIQFVRELSIAMSKINKVISVDTFVPYEFNYHYNIKELQFFCDYVVVMCYDEHYSGSKEAGSVSSVGYVADGINLTLKDVDKDKLVIALPFYCRIWTTSADGKVTSNAYGSQVAENAAITQGLTFTFDDTTKQNYGSKVTQDGSKVECWLEDNLSLAYKMELVRQADVAGTAAWKLTQERDNFFNIINMNIDN